jgi:signal transduction histidine kinase
MTAVSTEVRHRGTSPPSGTPPTPHPDPSDAIRAKSKDHQEQLSRRLISHDMRHQLSTVVLLASTLSTSSDIGRAGRARVAQLLLETKWLAELFRLYEQDLERAGRSESVMDQPTRLDVVAADVVRPIKMSSHRDVVLETEPTVAAVERLDIWRALRNVVGNAVTAAGPDGRVIVRVFSADGAAVVEVDDSGPGFDPLTSTAESLGLTIVRCFVRLNRGRMSIGRGTLGGCLVRLELPDRE